MNADERRGVMASKGGKSLMVTKGDMISKGEHCFTGVAISLNGLQVICTMREIRETSYKRRHGFVVTIRVKMGAEAGYSCCETYWMGELLIS